MIVSGQMIKESLLLLWRIILMICRIGSLLFTFSYQGFVVPFQIPPYMFCMLFKVISGTIINSAQCRYANLDLSNIPGESTNADSRVLRLNSLLAHKETRTGSATVMIDKVVKKLEISCETIYNLVPEEGMLVPGNLLNSIREKKCDIFTADTLKMVTLHSVNLNLFKREFKPGETCSIVYFDSINLNTVSFKLNCMFLTKFCLKNDKDTVDAFQTLQSFNTDNIRNHLANTMKFTGSLGDCINETYPGLATNYSLTRLAAGLTVYTTIQTVKSIMTLDSCALPKKHKSGTVGFWTFHRDPAFADAFSDGSQPPSGEVYYFDVKNIVKYLKKPTTGQVGSSYQTAKHRDAVHPPLSDIQNTPGSTNQEFTGLLQNPLQRDSGYSTLLPSTWNNQALRVLNDEFGSGLDNTCTATSLDASTSYSNEYGRYTSHDFASVSFTGPTAGYSCLDDSLTGTGNIPKINQGADDLSAGSVDHSILQTGTNKVIRYG